MRVYIAGPINGIPDGNRPAFLDAERRLQAAGHEPVNPHNISSDHTGPCSGPEVIGKPHRYGCYMKPDFKALLDCEGIHLLPGWELSRGAYIEEQVASICGIEEVVL